MADAATLGLWVLLTVTNGGNVSTASLPSKALCEDAASVARTGMTVAEKKKSDDDYAAAQKKRSDEWYASHPPREPKSDNERQQVAYAKETHAKGSYNGGWYTSCSGSTCVSAHVTEDYKIQDDPADGVFVTDVEDSINGIKYARCFLSGDK